MEIVISILITGLMIYILLQYVFCFYNINEKNKEIKVLSGKLTELSNYIIEIEKEKRELEEINSFQHEAISNINRINIKNIEVSPN